MLTLWRLFALTLNADPDPECWDQTSSAALNSLVAMSLRINASRISHDNRARFVHAINCRYSRTTAAGRAGALAEFPQIIDYIEEYQRIPDESLFVARVIALG